MSSELKSRHLDVGLPRPRVQSGREFAPLMWSEGSGSVQREEGGALLGANPVPKMRRTQGAEAGNVHRQTITTTAAGTGLVSSATKRRLISPNSSSPCRVDGDGHDARARLQLGRVPHHQKFVTEDPLLSSSISFKFLRSNPRNPLVAGRTPAREPRTSLRSPPPRRTLAFDSPASSSRKLKAEEPVAEYTPILPEVDEPRGLRSLFKRSKTAWQGAIGQVLFNHTAPAGGKRGRRVSLDVLACMLAGSHREAAELGLGPEAGDRAARSLARSPSKSRSFKTPYQMQRDELYTTEEALQQRALLRQHPDVLAAIYPFWDMVRKDSSNLVNKKGYLELHRAIHSAMVPGACDPVISEQDWIADSKGKARMNVKLFTDALFELADVWCDSMEAADYVDVLKTLHAQIQEKANAQDSVAPGMLALSGTENTSTPLKPAPFNASPLVSNRKNRMMAGSPSPKKVTGLGVEGPNLQGARNLHRATARMMRMERTAAELASKFDTVHDSATPSPPSAAQATKSASSGHAAATGAGREAGDPPRGELDAVQGADVDVPETEESILDRKILHQLRLVQQQQLEEERLEREQDERRLRQQQEQQMMQESLRESRDQLAKARMEVSKLSGRHHRFRRHLAELEIPEAAEASSFAASARVASSVGLTPQHVVDMSFSSQVEASKSCRSSLSMAGFVRATEKTQAERARECVAALLARARSARNVGEALDASCADLDGKIDPDAARGLSVEIPLDAGTVASPSAANTPIPDSERLSSAHTSPQRMAPKASAPQSGRAAQREFEPSPLGMNSTKNAAGAAQDRTNFDSPDSHGRSQLPRLPTTTVLEEATRSMNHTEDVKFPAIEPQTLNTLEGSHDLASVAASESTSFPALAAAHISQGDRSGYSVRHSARVGASKPMHNVRLDPRRSARFGSTHRLNLKHNVRFSLSEQPAFMSTINGERGNRRRTSQGFLQFVAAQTLRSQVTSSLQAFHLDTSPRRMRVAQ